MLALSECRELLKSAGFREIQVRYMIFFPKQVSFMRCLERCISWLPLGAQYMAEGITPTQQE
ncbi:MAG: hypothetical protein IJT02_09555 [Synergistaceae bacterium]|nr:hypothetical protein [Synergistaceae bacterium]